MNTEKLKVHTKEPAPLPGKKKSNLDVIRVRADFPSVSSQCCVLMPSVTRTIASRGTRT